jgi:hypothetical protein
VKKEIAMDANLYLLNYFSLLGSNDNFQNEKRAGLLSYLNQTESLFLDLM